MQIIITVVKNSMYITVNNLTVIHVQNVYRVINLVKTVIVC